MAHVVEVTAIVLAVAAAVAVLGGIVFVFCAFIGWTNRGSH